MPVKELSKYASLVNSLPYGKRLPNAVYVHRDGEPCRTGSLGRILDELSVAHQIGAEFNVVKLRTDLPRLSFLSYPGFFDEAHPALKASIAVDLNTGRSYHTDYGDSVNPPILHRKELFLPPDHPRTEEYRALSKAEEDAGLYRNTALIGFRFNWERLLSEFGVEIDGHTLKISSLASHPESVLPQIERHRTALTRYAFSKPVKTILEYGQLKPSDTLLDYGCGRGGDVRGLREIGYSATGWDPVYAPEAPRTEATVVLLSYVINVIENPIERTEALLSAWALTGRLLVVAARVGGAGANGLEGEVYGDGILTTRNTFQKYYSQNELQQYLEDTLQTAASPAAVGVFYLFRNSSENQEFIQSRSRRAIDWSGLRFRIDRIHRPQREPRPPREVKRSKYDEHRDLLDDLWQATLNLGRLPHFTEYSRSSEICSAFGSAARALRALLARDDAGLFQKARAARKDDLLVYLACSNLRRTIPFSQLPQAVRLDIREFFGTYRKGLTEGMALLHSAADGGTITLACEDASVGWQDRGSLYVHTELVDRLPVVLRAYVACAEVLFGDMRQADIVKIHKGSSKISFLSYSNFRSAILPELATRTKVNLRTSWVEAFDHQREGQLLYFKERFIAPEDPTRPDLAIVSEILKSLGLSETDFFGPRSHELKALLNQMGSADLFERLTGSQTTPSYGGNRA